MSKVLSFLSKHPFPVQAFFESSIVLAYAIPKKELLSFIPRCLSLDTYQDKWGFIAVAMVTTKALRPKGFPEFMGNNFFLMGYRIFVRYNSVSGKKLRGLYILKSTTDRKKMEFFGNIFTKYNYTTADFLIKDDSGRISIESQKENMHVIVDTKSSNVDLPKDSPFPDWNEARKFAGPMPFTFSVDSLNKEVTIIEGLRQNWKPRPIKVIQNNVGFMDSLNLPSAILANAFIIENVPYSWKKGETENWKT
ncbi:MAG: DUF2071 domain-containing protein [Leptospiraceae bacterium]|nr:DUF2071 domain-containing protein [Leptospiraceae bacterium]